jgi:hypothetical protein
MKGAIGSGHQRVLETIGMCHKKNTFLFWLSAMLWIRISFNTDPDPAFYVNAEPVPVPDPGIWWQKIVYFYSCQIFLFFSKIAIYVQYLSLGLHEGRPSYTWEASSLPKRIPSTIYANCLLTGLYETETELRGRRYDDNIKKQTNIDRHGPKPSSNSSQPPDPLNFYYPLYL